MHKKKGFTLIELLIVVAIIGILAAIAIPNFLEAQTRAKVSRVMGDMRTLGLALESYYVDWNQYPWQHLATANIMSTWWLYVVRNTGVDASAGSSLTTPIAYVSSIPIDPFTTQAYKDLPTYGVKQSSVLYRWKAPGRSLDWPSSFYETLVTVWTVQAPIQLLGDRPMHFVFMIRPMVLSATERFFISARAMVFPRRDGNAHPMSNIFTPLNFDSRGTEKNLPMKALLCVLHHFCVKDFFPCDRISTQPVTSLR